jgi:hypothetical protein
VNWVTSIISVKESRKIDVAFVLGMLQSCTTNGMVAPGFLGTHGGVFADQSNARLRLNQELDWIEGQGRTGWLTHSYNPSSFMGQAATDSVIHKGDCTGVPATIAL